MHTLCLYTAQFPYGLGEQFIETEINYLARAFGRVVIIPAQCGGRQRQLPANVEVMRPNVEGYSTIKGIRALGRWTLGCMADAFKNPDKKYAASHLLRMGFNAGALWQFLQQHNLVHNTLHYTYWLDDWSTSLSILISKKRISGYISRAHRYDLYEDRNKLGYIPFRKFQLQHITRLYLISENGLQYMKSRYPQHSHKYHLSYLGVENVNPFRLLPADDEHYTVVSCSRVVDIKRVDMICEALSQITDIPIKWIHFGDGPLFDNLKQCAQAKLPDNVKWEFKGMKPNSEVLSFYGEYRVDCFVNVSSSEGLPVSIMEAISYGIPVVATDVGGTSEIVSSEVGVLLKSNPSIEEIRDALVDTINLPSLSNHPSSADKEALLLQRRQSVYDFWHHHFNATVNYQSFANDINRLELK